MFSTRSSLQYDCNPIETVKTRLKSPESLLEKLGRRKLPVSVESIEENITDVAGVRVICSYVSDIYMLAESFARQDDITVIRRKDYIQNPRPSGLFSAWHRYGPWEYTEYSLRSMPRQSKTILTKLCPFSIKDEYEKYEKEEQDMATGKEFMAQLESRFGQLSPEDKLNKLVEYQKRLTALQKEGLSEDEAVARLSAELPLPSPTAPEHEDYGRISHPKKPLLTGALYTLALAAVIAAAGLFTRLFA